jgi:hypothetical protein
MMAVLLEGLRWPAALASDESSFVVLTRADQSGAVAACSEEELERERNPTQTPPAKSGRRRDAF